MNRWDPDYMENLQGHMKTVSKFVMCFFKECGDVLKLQGRSFELEMLKEEVITNRNLIRNHKKIHIHWPAGT